MKHVTITDDDSLVLQAYSIPDDEELHVYGFRERNAVPYQCKRCGSTEPARTAPTCLSCENQVLREIIAKQESELLSAELEHTHRMEMGE